MKNTHFLQTEKMINFKKLPSHLRSALLVQILLFYIRNGKLIERLSYGTNGQRIFVHHLDCGCIIISWLCWNKAIQVSKVSLFLPASSPQKPPFQKSWVVSFIVPEMPSIGTLTLSNTDDASERLFVGLVCVLLDKRSKANAESLFGVP